MKTITTSVLKVNGQFDIYASENTQRTQSYSELAEQQVKDYSSMSKSAKVNFRKRNQGKCGDIETIIETFTITATIPDIFSEFQLKQALIDCLINNRQNRNIFIPCKNGTTGYSTGNFKISA
jgi:hypothetical protein